MCAPVGAASAEANDVKIEMTSSLVGEELTVVVTAAKNDGIITLLLCVDYDEAQLLPTKVVHNAETFSSLTMTDNFAKVSSGESNVYRVLYDGEGENEKGTGELFTMTFRVKEGAVNGKHSVDLYVKELTYKVGDAYSVTGINEKYAAAGGQTIGVKVTSAQYVITNGVPAPEEGKNHTLVIVLAAVGAAIAIGGFLAAYFIYRKKQANLKKSKTDTEN